MMKDLNKILILTFSIVFGTSCTKNTIETETAEHKINSEERATIKSEYDTSVYGDWKTKNHRGNKLIYSVKINIEQNKLTYMINCTRELDGLSVSSRVSVPVHITSDYIETLNSANNKVDKYGIECKANISPKKIFYKVEDNYLFLYKSKDKKSLITTYTRPEK